MEPELFNAARCGNAIELMRVADRNPRTLEGSTFNGNTALHIASVHGHTDFVVTICALCPSLLLRLNSRGDTALHVAAKAGHLALVAELIDCAERMGFKGQMLRMTNAEKNTVLHEAVRHRNHKLVDLLIEKDRDLVFVPNKAESSALHVAAEEGDAKSVQDILNVTKDALNASWRGPKGLTPLHAAVLRQQIDVARVLCKERPGFLLEKDVDNRYPIHYAVALGNLEMVQIFLEQDVSIAYLGDGCHRWPFHLAAINDHISIMDELLRSLPDSCETRDMRKWNALHFAVEKGNLKAVRYILNSDKLEELINQRNEEGNTPLHLAILSRQFSTSLILLMDDRVDFTAINYKGQTALDITESDNKKSRKLEKILIWNALTQKGGKRALGRTEELEAAPEKESYKGLSSAISTVAGLIISVSFAAAFTIPSAYHNNASNKDKSVILTGKPLLWIFMITDSLAFFSSICVALLLFFVGIGDDALLLAAVSRSLTLMAIAMLSLTLCFLLGIALVLSKWFAIVVSLFCIVFFFSLLHWLFSWAPVLFLYFKFRIANLLSAFFGLCSNQRSTNRNFQLAATTENEPTNQPPNSQNDPAHQRPSGSSVPP